MMEMAGLKVARRILRLARRLAMASVVSEFRKRMERNSGETPERIDEMAKFLETISDSKSRKLARHVLERGLMEFPKEKDLFNAVIANFGLKRSANYESEFRRRDDFLMYADPLGYAARNPGNRRAVELGRLLNMRIRRNELKSGMTFDPRQAFRFMDDYDGYDVYQVGEDREDMMNVRKALDVAYGMHRNPWCLASYDDSSLDGMGNAWDYWREYSKSPKRIAFDGNSPVAFFADWQWWDLTDDPTDDFPYADPNEVFDQEQEFNEDVARNGTVGQKRSLADSSQDSYVLDVLSFSDDEETLESVALNKYTDEETLEHLAKEGSDRVKEAVAENRNAYEETLEELASSGSMKVKYAVAGNPHAGDEALWGLYSSGDKRILMELAVNARLPEDLALEMARKGDDDIIGMMLSRGKKSVRVMREMAMNAGIETLRSLADKADDPGVIRMLYDRIAPSSPDFEMCHNLARNIRTPSDVLKGMFESIDFSHDREMNRSFMSSLGRNRNLPVSCAEKLADSFDDVIRYSVEHVEGKVADHVSGTRELAKMIRDGDIGSDELRKHASSGYNAVLVAVAGRADAPTDVLDRLAREHGRDNDIAIELARNESTSASSLEMLSKSGCEDVRYNVSRNSNCPETAQIRIGVNDTMNIACNILRNPSVTRKALMEMAKNGKSELIREWSLRRLKEKHAE